MRTSSIVPALMSAALAATTASATAITIVHPGVIAPRISPDHAKVVKISKDAFTNPDSQHRTEVEPDTFAWGNTMVVTFQEGRFQTSGGASDIGWATTTDSGATWHHGNFHGITKIQNPNAPYDRASNASIGYDAKHGRWLASILPLANGVGGNPVVVRSKNGVDWSKPIKTAPDNGDNIQKPWISCDNWKTSPYYGNCYIESDDFTLGDQELMSTSTDGGLTWSAPYAVPGLFGDGGQPLALPNGTVVVTDINVTNATISAFRSTDGGQTWGNDVDVAPMTFIAPGGSLRFFPFPSAEISGNGRIYVAWPDCSFRPSCTSNDIVYSSSTDGVTWEKVKRIPIDGKMSNADHFFPGLAVDRNTKPPNVHLTVTYYYYPVASCLSGQCELIPAYISSADGGKTWSDHTKLWNAMNPQWLANTDQGYMCGNYISTSYMNGLAYPGIDVAKPPVSTLLDQFMVSSATGVSTIPELQLNHNPAEELQYRVRHYPFHRPLLPAI
jgi:hypothetical protein